MNTPINSKVHSTQTMEFPREVQDRVQNAIARRRTVPQTHHGRAVPVTPQAQQAQRTPIANAIPQAPANPAMEVDPQLMGMVQSSGNSGVYHNPMNSTHRKAMQNQMVQQAQQELAGQAYGAEAQGQPAPEWYATPQPQAANVDAPMIRNPMPGFVVPLADSGGSSLALPSHFAYYGFKDLYVVPFKNAHLAKLQRAHAEQSLQPVVEVVSTVVYTSTPGYKNLAFELTMPDFFFVLFWLRMHSFTKTQFIHKTKCTNPEHLQAVKEGKYLADTLDIKRVIDKTTLATHELDYIPDPEEFNFGPESDIQFSPPRMRDVLEFLDHPMMRDPNTRTEFSYLAQQASHIQGIDAHLTLDQRIDIVENLEPDYAALIKKFEKVMKSYGVEESVQVQCKGCGASRKSPISLGAHSFLSFE